MTWLSLREPQACSSASTFALSGVNQSGAVSEVLDEASMKVPYLVVNVTFTA